MRVLRRAVSAAWSIFRKKGSRDRIAATGRQKERGTGIEGEKNPDYQFDGSRIEPPLIEKAAA